MYKVLIVDDEPTIRAGLQTLIDWEHYGFKVVGDAMNGREALSKYDELAPHLIIIDIRMPVMDGLQVIEQIRATDTSCRFLILTGYADFEYAKRAILGRVDGYILKPVDEEEMIAELVRVHKHLQKQDELENITAQSASRRREELIQALLAADTVQLQLPSADLEGLIGASKGGYQVLLIQPATTQASDSRLYSTIKQGLIDKFESAERGVVFSSHSCLGILLKEPVADARARRTVYSEIRSCLPEISFHVAIGSAVKQIKDVSVSFQEAAELLTYHYLCADELIVRHNVNLDGDHPAIPDMASLAEKLYYAIDLGNRESLERLLERTGAELVACDRSESGLKTNYAQLTSLALNKLAGQNDKTYTIVQDSMSIIAQIYVQPNLAALQACLRRQLCDLASRISGSGNEPVLKQVMDFIERHYAENLKLDTLAELFNYTSGYLGKIFKNYTGAHFHTYLDQVRIRKAIELLGEGLKVHQVAERVGYANADYFHSKFKKYVGESPSSYKGKAAK
ncbi:response regulator transcription factor [Paenibacillus sedimenti]|uniref:Response regulator transcription factor n=1 Tax=Paenibacillus sedimenti TaxID=2770274 RepID=A0A926QLT4_9BACL|nr:response regulator transcription factor [Paenibacillus sedimenti]MBD0384251.1 response regulator transcription factor [Paenibacillus sedimenti]